MMHMAFVNVAEPVHQVVDTPDGLRLLIQSRKNWSVLGTMLIWLGLWLFSEVKAVPLFWSRTTGSERAFISLWILGWTLGGLFVASSLLWMLKGHEIVTLKPQGLVFQLRREIYGVSFRTLDFDLSKVCHLRVSNFPDRSVFRTSMIGRADALAFDYGARTYRFGTGLAARGEKPAGM